ncbi:MAG: hypothetical protein P4L69_14315 [Desulfosporosinus sp.]|nr:hypothetical protein [Desulfosporosinus sp.]
MNKKFTVVLVILGLIMSGTAFIKGFSKKTEPQTVSASEGVL